MNADINCSSAFTFYMDVLVYILNNPWIRWKIFYYIRLCIRKVNQHVRNNGTKGHDWILRSKDVILWSNEIKSDVLKFCKLVSGLDADFYDLKLKNCRMIFGVVF